MFYTIGELAKKFGVAPSTLRYYDKEGLLPFIERSRGGIRMFREEDLRWLSMIECLKKTGMSIKEIKSFMDWSIEGDSTIDQRLALIQQQKISVSRQIAEMQANYEMLEYKEWYYKIAQQSGTCDVHNTLSCQDVPKKFRKYKE